MTPVTRALVLDTGAMIAAERGDPKLRAALDRARASSLPVFVPTSVLAQAWGDDRRQAALARIMSDAIVRSLDGPTARAVGHLLARTGTSDVVDGHVAICALRDGGTILTSDPDDLRRLAPGVPVVRV